MKHTIKNWLAECKNLNGDPRYIGRGMAIGIFISLTPFFPFHMAIAVTLAILLRGSKRAAAVGVWLSNPLTIPFCYFIIYKLGIYILGTNPVYNPDWKTFADILKMGLGIFYAMIVGGVVLGSALAVPAYYITKKIFQRMQSRGNRNGAQPGAQTPPAASEAATK